MAGPRAYVASPLGFTELGRLAYPALLKALAGIVDIVDPWSLLSHEEAAAALQRGGDEELNRLIGETNAAAIEKCDLVIAVLEGQEVDSGTAAEVGYAAASGVRCFGLRTDRREAGERGARVNLQLESFILRSGGKIFGSLEELRTELPSAIL